MVTEFLVEVANAIFLIYSGGMADIKAPIADSGPVPI